MGPGGARWVVEEGFEGFEAVMGADGGGMDLLGGVEMGKSGGM